MMKQQSQPMLKQGGKYFFLLIGLLFFIFNNNAAIAEPQFPAFTNYVVDEAHLLDSATYQTLVQKLEAFEKQSSDQVVVVIVPDLGGLDYRTYGVQLARHWQIGQKDINNGVLLLVAPNDRRVSIEVGYGLEGVMTDAMASTIINGIILPNFRNDNYSQGITDGVDSILDVIKGDQAGFEKRIEDQKKAQEKAQAREEFINNIIKFIIFCVFVVIIVLPALAQIFGKKVGPNRYLWLGIVFIVVFGSGKNGGNGGSSGSFGGGGFGGGGGGGFGGGGGGSFGGGGAGGRW